MGIYRGLDALLFTEHGMYWEQAKIDAMQAMFPQIKIYSGIEIALTEGYHVVVFGKRILDHPSDLLTMSQLKRLIQTDRQDIFLFVAHAFRYQPLPMPSLAPLLRSCDGLEMNSINILRGHACMNGPKIVSDKHDLYRQYLRDFKLTPLYNTDGHDDDVIGVIANQFPNQKPPQDEIGLAHLFKTLHPIEFQNHALLSKHYLLNIPEHQPQLLPNC